MLKVSIWRQLRFSLSVHSKQVITGRLIPGLTSQYEHLHSFPKHHIQKCVGFFCVVYFLLRILKLSVQILRCYHFFNIFWIFWSRWLLLLWTPSKRLDQLTKKKKTKGWRPIGTNLAKQWSCTSVSHKLWICYQTTTLYYRQDRLVLVGWHVNLGRNRRTRDHCNT